MNTNLIALYSNDPNKNKDIILNIKNFILQNNKYSDFTIISDSTNLKGINNTSLIFSFYLKFFNGTIIFIDINDYLLYKDEIIAKCIVFLQNNDLSTVDRNCIKECDILTIENNSIKLTNNHGI